MSEIIAFKVFGFTEAEIRAKLAGMGLTPIRVEEYCLDALVEVGLMSDGGEVAAFEVFRLFDGCVYSEKEESLAEAVLGRLRLYGKKLSVAESLTGGMITDHLVSVPGCSESVIEGLVTYSNESKVNRLGVDPSVIKMYGAVSAEVARQMAKGLYLTGADFAISTTGIAGPGGGSEEKPVGLVYIGVADDVKCTATECRFEGTREQIRTLACNTALFLLWKRVVKPFDFDSMVIE